MGAQASGNLGAFGQELAVPLVDDPKSPVIVVLLAFRVSVKCSLFIGENVSLPGVGNTVIQVKSCFRI